MNRIEEIRENAGVRGKALLITIADIMDNVAKRNIALAGDVAGFAASQVRLPAQVVDLNDYREPLAQRVSLAIGTAVTFEGPINLDLSLQPRLIAERIRIANPQWASRSHLRSGARRRRLASGVPRRLPPSPVVKGHPRSARRPVWRRAIHAPRVR